MPTPPGRLFNGIVPKNPGRPSSSTLPPSDGTLIDGYTRYEILWELGIPITWDMIEIREVPDYKIRDEVFDENIARRQLPEIRKVARVVKM